VPQTSKTGGCRFESCRPCKRKPRISGAPVFSVGNLGGLAEIPFDSGGPPEIFEVHKLRKR